MSDGVEIDEFAVHAYVAAAGGAVARDLERRAIRVQNVATQLCPVDTGRLRASIDHEMGVDSIGVYADVGSNVEYARYVEEGTQFAEAQPFLRPALSAAG